MGHDETPARPQRLRENLDRHFDLEELRTLCADLGVDYDSLGGEGKQAKARELVASLDRSGRLPDLVRRCAQLRPRVDWGEAPASALRVNAPPLPLHRLVGRDKLLADLRGRLLGTGPAPHTAISGLPGVGKTALAIALAHDDQVLAHFSGGVLWAGLGRNPAVDDILNQWASALGMDPGSATETAARARLVQSAIARRGKPMLVVIDDAWSIEPAAALALPGCACLLTTRSPVLAAEFALQGACPVPELSEDDALALLAQFAPQACQAESAEALALVRQVGCLPLAIVLTGRALTAAAHSGQPRRIRQAFERLKRIEERLRVERPLGPGQPPISLLAAIRMSDEAIGDETARRAFWALGAFAPKPADFAEEAALAVAQCETAVLDRLVDLGLLDVSGAGRDRYTLHQEIAHYAALMTGDDHSPRQRHAQYYLDWVNQDREAWQRIEPELEQIRFVWAYITTPSPKNHEIAQAREGLIVDVVLAMARFLGTRGPWREEIAWCERGLEAARLLGKRSKEGELLIHIAWCQNAFNDRRLSLKYYEQALFIFRQAGDSELEAEALNGIGSVYHNLAEYGQAQASYGEALSICQKTGNRAGEAQTLDNVGQIYNALGERTRALEYFERALPISHEAGDHAQEAVTLLNTGAVYASLGEHRRALEHLARALSAFREMGHRVFEARTLDHIGGVHRNLVEYNQALDCYREALSIYRQVGDQLGEARTLNNIGEVYHSLGERRRALEYYGQALPTSCEVGDRVSEAITLNNIGLVYDHLGERRRALEYYEQALPIRREVGDRAGERMTLKNMAIVHQAGGNHVEAVRLLERVIAIDQAIEHPDLESDRAVLEKARRRAQE